jgi:hypothetical protein
MYLYLGFGVSNSLLFYGGAGVLFLFDGVYVVLVDCTGSRMTMRW